MKKYILVIAAALFAVSCQKDFEDVIPSVDTESSVKPMIINFSAEDSRATYQNLYMMWEGTEKLGLFSDNAYYEWGMEGVESKFFNKPVKNVKMQIKDEMYGPGAIFEIDSSYATDTPSLTGRFGWDPTVTNADFYMYYPYNGKAKMATTVDAVPFTLSSVQSQKPVSDNGELYGNYDFIYSKATLEVPSEAAEKEVIEADLTFTFHHVFSILKFSASNSLSKEVHLRAVKFTTPEGTALTGDMVFNLTTGEKQTGKTVSDGGQVINGVASNSVMTELVSPYVYKSGAFYINVFINPVDLKGQNVTATLYFDEGYQEFSFQPSKSFEAGKVYTHTLTVKTLQEYKDQVITFEDLDSKYLAGPTAYGDNLYDERDGNESGLRYTSYTDPATGFTLSLNMYDDWYGSGSWLSLLGGGSFISQWNNLEDGTYMNQCSVYYKDGTTTFGGAGGSKTFSVATGFDSSFSQPASYSFKSGSHVIKSVEVCNTTYAALAMLNGAAPARKLSYDNNDWFCIKITGYDEAGVKGKTVIYYLADFRTADAPGVVGGWHKIDLTSLGAVNKILVDFDSSDVSYGYMNTPAYVAFDNFEIEGGIF